MSDPAARPYPFDLPSDELICLPFLDGGSDDERRAARDELLRRGYPPWLIDLLRRVARIGLWYQVVAWEWGSLGIFDVLLGYGVILVLASPFPFVVSPTLSGVLLLAGVSSVTAAYFGFRWRRR